MPARFQRIGLVVQLLLAIFADLRRRAWWAYRAGFRQQGAPPIARVERRVAEPEIRAPLVTAAWRPLADRALPLLQSARVELSSGESCAAIWIDVRGRPDIADLPRILESGARASTTAPVAATQWLFDPPSHTVILIATIVDPVTATCPVRFQLPDHRALLELIAATAQLGIAFGPPPMLPRHLTLPLSDPLTLSPGMILPIASTAQLRHILWADEHSIPYSTC